MDDNRPMKDGKLEKDIGKADVSSGKIGLLFGIYATSVIIIAGVVNKLFPSLIRGKYDNDWDRYDF